MSHRDDCPDRWTARRAGRHDFESRGYRSRDPYDCDEANQAYRDGQRAAQYDADVTAEREDSARRERRRHEREMECVMEEERGYAAEEFYEQMAFEQDVIDAEYEAWGAGP